MLPNFSEIFPERPDSSRVWLYLSNRVFDSTELGYIENVILDFTQSKWSAHGSKLEASGTILFNQLVILAVDEQTINASGCSIDSSVRMIKELGTELNVDFFNRMYVLVYLQNQFKRIHIHELKNYKEAQLINPLVTTLGEIRKEFLVEVSKSPLFI